VKQNDVKVQAMILLDTDVMVDLMRGYEPALTWLDSLGAETIGIPGLVAMELLQGCRLATFNERHYRVVSALQTIRPYPR